MYRSLSITLVACLAIGGWAWSLQANADGTYLAVSPGAESPSPHDGVYVYDVAHGTWSRIWRHTVDLEWLPDNTRMVVSGRRGRPMRFTLLTRLGAARALPTLPRMGTMLRSGRR